MSTFGGKADTTELIGPLMLLPVLAAEASQTFDIEHRDHPVLHLDQPRFLQHLQSMIDRLPRRTNEMGKLFVGDFNAAFPARIELRMQHVRDGVGHPRFWPAEVCMLERAHELPEAFVELGQDEAVERNACVQQPEKCDRRHQRDA